MIFCDKLKWAIYDPVTESVTHGDLGDTPRESRADEGRGAVIRPLYEPEPGDVLYCKRLSGWWKTIENRRAEERDTVAQCVSVITRKSTFRIHRLISETDHESDPGGYFDCTVQVSFLPNFSLYIPRHHISPHDRYYGGSKTIMEYTVSTSQISPRIKL